MEKSIKETSVRTNQMGKANLQGKTGKLFMESGMIPFYRKFYDKFHLL